MLIHSCKRTFILVMVLFVAACSKADKTASTITSIPVDGNQKETVIVSPTPTEIASMTPVANPTKRIATLTPSPTEENATIHKDCPVVISAGVIKEGTLFWNVNLTGEDHSQIWSRSSNDQEPSLLLETSKDNIPITSATRDGNYYLKFPNSEEIVWIHRETDQLSTSLWVLHIDNLSLTKFDLPKLGAFSLVDWIDNHQVLLRETSLKPDYVQFRDLVFSLKNQTFIFHEKELHLPGHPFFPDDRWYFFEHFYSVSNNRAFYTALSDTTTKLVLYDLEHQIPMWEKTVPGAPLFSQPSWSNNGNYVSFAYPSIENGERKIEIYTFDKDGNETMLTSNLDVSSLIDNENNYDVINLKWSPSDRYLHFSLGGIPSPNGTGYIIDVASRKILPICDSEVANIQYGRWLPDADLFVYIAELSDGKFELRVLDPQTWQVQIITTFRNITWALDINVLGWSK